jgi:hypothetical protein
VIHEPKRVGLNVNEVNKLLEKSNLPIYAFRGEDGQAVGLGIDLIQSSFTEYFTLIPRPSID